MRVHIGALMYGDEHEDRFPAQPGDGLPVRAAGGDGMNYYDLLMPNLGDARVWLCPSTKESPGKLISYHMNGLIITTNGLKAPTIEQPSHTLLIGESGRTRWNQAFLRPDQSGGYLYDRPQINHSGGGNATFVDGHVKWHHDSHWTSNYFRVYP